MSLAAYLRWIGETPRPTEEECRELAWRVLAGDMEAREQLVRGHLLLVVQIARDYRTNRGADRMDIISSGNLGLIHAADTYRADMPHPFEAHARKLIGSAIGRTLANTSAVVRLPDWTWRLVARWRGAEQRLREALGRTPTHDEVAAELQLTGNMRGSIEAALRVVHVEALPAESE